MERRARRIRRRLRTVPTHLLLFLSATVLAPVWVPLALLVDALRWVITRRPFMTIRLFAFGWVYLAASLRGLAALLVQWVRAGFGRDIARMRRDAYGVQERWARLLFTVVERLFRLEVAVEGLDRAAPGRTVYLMRHASVLDTLLPNAIITSRAGVRLRYVLKRELLADPALDYAGNRLLNHFVDRAGDSVEEVAAIVALADDLAPDEGVIIYPEGTRFTEERRERVIESLEERRPSLAERARGLRRVLPPRPGGAVALLGTGLDAVVVAHTGLEPLATIPDAWSGRIVGSAVRVAFTRFDGGSIPEGEDARVDWLFERWREVDDWLAR